MKNPAFISTLGPLVHHTWLAFLTDEILETLNIIEKQLMNSAEEYTPPVRHVLRFLQTNLDKVQINILGQDPYPQKGVATGRAFEAGNLTNWNEKFSNVSLKNIVRSIYKAYTGKSLKYSEILLQPPDVFKLLPPAQLFNSWEKQGALLLNTSFTVETGKPGSHSKDWQKFTSALLNFLAETKPEIIWFLWGNHARQICSGIPLQKKLVSRHPMMCFNGNGRADDFLFGNLNHFYETKHLIDWRGRIEDT